MQAVRQSIDEELRFAIANKRLVQLCYSGRVRVVEPHDYGVQKHTPRLLAYQLRESGGTPRQSGSGWRLFDLTKIDSFSALEQAFSGSRGASHQRHNTWDVLYARVS